MNFYFAAAEVLDRLDSKKGSVKSLISTVAEKDRKRTSALVIQTLKYKPVLVDIIDQAKIMKEERKKLTSLNLTLVLVHDVLFASGIQAGDGPIKQAILRHKTRLHSELQKIKIKRGVKRDEDLAQTADQRAALIPRYVRINTLLWEIEEAMQYFASKGFVLKEYLQISSTSKKEFAKDEHIPALLLFHPDVSFQDDDAYKAGKVILQDKASCFPAVVLDPPVSSNGSVIDATSAPGNKTSHLSALMSNTGTLFAFERDRKRFSTLEMMLSRAKCKNVVPVNDDFLKVDPMDLKYSQVTHILLDPSCSGSGIVNRLDYLIENEQDAQVEQEERLQKLASFQLMMIKHAMKFPAVQRIVYSTCSVHAIEDEHVVRAVLKSDEALSGHFKLAPENEVLPQWKRRGFPSEMDDPRHAASLVRCLPGEDATNGFFVSCFIRCSEQEDSETEPSQSRKRKLDVLGADVEISAHQTEARRKKKKKKNKLKVEDSAPVA
ncbi:S-adenosyl-L-methionine-dependent methyltransferase [Lentinula raphanica]|nr:S-adenosyl-L-methionine-dependent methyltransferase [Lentinula raphanica]